MSQDTNQPSEVPTHRIGSFGAQGAYHQVINELSVGRYWEQGFYYVIENIDDLRIKISFRNQLGKIETEEIETRPEVLSLFNGDVSRKAKHDAQYYEFGVNLGYDFLKTSKRNALSYPYAELGVFGLYGNLYQKRIDNYIDGYFFEQLEGNSSTIKQAFASVELNLGTQTPLSPMWIFDLNVGIKHLRQIYQDDTLGPFDVDGLIFNEKQYMVGIRAGISYLIFKN